MLQKQLDVWEEELDDKEAVDDAGGEDAVEIGWFSWTFGTRRPGVSISVSRVAHSLACSS